LKKSEVFDKFILENDLKDICEKVANENDIIGYRVYDAVLNENKIYYLIIEEETVNQYVFHVIYTLNDLSKKAKILELINELNFEYPIVKFYMDNENKVSLSVRMLASSDLFDPRILHLCIFALRDVLEKTYNRFMKIQWGY